jgi:hypothetical protein
MNLAHRTRKNSAAGPSSSSARLYAIAEQKTTPVERLAASLAGIVSEMVQEQAEIIAAAMVEKMEKQGWKAPTPSEAYVAEAAVREALGRRGSPMASVTFRKDWIDSGRITRVPASTTGNAKAQYIYFSDVEKHFGEKIADQLRPKIQQPEHLKRK